MTINRKYADYDVQDFLKDEFFVRWAREEEPELADFWDRWIAEHPSKASKINEAKRLIQSVRYKNVVELEDDEYIQLYENILKQESRTVKPRRSRINLYRIAAAVALIAISYAMVLSYPEKQQGELASETLETRSTNFGEKLTIRLSDGSTVKLNAGSELAFKEHFDDGIREVRLKGEAFFEVAKDETRPFIVRTEIMSVEALGTSFNVESYNENVDHTITLITGKVGVSNGDESGYAVLTPGQQAKAGRDLELSVSEVDISKFIEWRDGIISFDETEFDQVLLKLERWYGVSIKVSGQKGVLNTFSGRFENEELESILDVLSYSSGFSYTINKKEIQLNF